ncbi:MAG TPA: hypothetical protein VKB93_25465 [Thermoanaerobaculia bacterium]|nr:hypothetical protein [Thermoanaerobaculia bacterium]
MIRYALALLLAVLTFAALRTSPEHELTPRTLDIAASPQSFPRLAGNGSEFLAVWTDGPYYENDVLAARLAPNGAVLDRVPLVIAATSAREEFATVEWGGDRYLVVWSNNDRILGRFVFNDGSLSDVFPIATRVSQFPTQRLEVAFHGGVFLVAWHDGAAFQATIVDRAGRIGPARELARGSFVFDLVATRDSFYFVYLNESSPKTFVALQLDDDVRVRSRFDVASAVDYVVTFRAEPRGDEFLLAWTESGYQLHSVRVTPAGVQEHLFFDAGFQTLQAVAADDAGYLLIYGNSHNTHWRRPGDSSESNVPVPALSSGATAVFAATSNGTHTIALVHTLPPYDLTAQDLFVSILDEDTAPPLVLAPQQQTAPEAAAAGDTTLVVWRETHPSEDRTIIAGRRVDPRGDPLGDAFEIGGDVDYASRPRIASNGAGWLVIWESGYKLLGRRIRHDGTFLDGAPLVLDEPVLQGHTTVTWDGSSYVVAYSYGLITRFPQFQIRARRVPASGEPPAAFGVTTSGNHVNPVIASGSNGSLLVWVEGLALRGVLLSQTGTVTPLAFPAGFSRAPSVAWNGDTFLVAADSPSNAVRELRWLRVDSSGNVLESPFTFRVESALTVPDVEPFGDGFLLYWIHDQQLFAALLQRDGTPLEAATAIAPNPHSFAAAGALLVIAHAIDHPTKPVRVFVQTIERTQPPVRRRAVTF